MTSSGTTAASAATTMVCDSSRWPRMPRSTSRQTRNREAVTPTVIVVRNQGRRVGLFALLHCCPGAGSGPAPSTPFGPLVVMSAGAMPRRLVQPVRSTAPVGWDG